MQGHPHTYKKHDLTSAALHEGRRGISLYGMYVAWLLYCTLKALCVSCRCGSNITATTASTEGRFVHARDLSSAHCSMLGKGERTPGTFKPLDPQCPLFFRKVHKDAAGVAEDLLFGVLSG